MNTKALRLVKYLAQASKQEKKEEHHELVKQVKKVKTLAKKTQTQPLQEELVKLESQISQVLKLEKNLLRREQTDVTSLNNQLNDLRLRLSVSESGPLRQRLDRILFLLGELTSRIDSYATMKEARQKRIEEIEKKVKESVERNFKEIITIEKSISSLDTRYSELKQNRDIDQKHLKRIESKLKELRFIY